MLRGITEKGKERRPGTEKWKKKKKEQTQRMGNRLGWFCFHS